MDCCPITPSTEVRNLGVILDSTLSFLAHTKNTTTFHLLPPLLLLSLADSVTEAFIHSFINSHLDYCNRVLYGLPSKALDRLYVQNSAARVLIRTKLWQHITPTLTQLHWLLVKTFITLTTSHTQSTHTDFLQIPSCTCYPEPLRSLPPLFPVKVSTVPWQGPACHLQGYRPLVTEPFV